MKTNVRKYIANYFLCNKITIKEVAQKMGVSAPHVSNILNGKSPMGGTTARKLNQHFGFSISWILTGEGPVFDKNTGNDFESQRMVEELEQKLLSLQEKYDDLCVRYDNLQKCLLDNLENNGYVVGLQPLKNC